MKAIFAIIILLAASLAFAQQLNSSSFRISSNTLDSSGGKANSSSFNLQSSLNSISGPANSSSYRATFGFISTLALSANAPQIMNQTITGSNWNQPLNFTVLTRDVDNETVTVSFYTSNDNVSFTLRSTATCNQCRGPTQFNFTLSYVCSDIGIKYFKFVASDGSLTNETGPLNFSVLRAIIDQPDITFSEGAGQTINTYSTINFTFRLYDTYNRTNVSNTNASFYISNIGSYNKFNCVTNSTGHCRLALTPTCDYSGGVHSLIGGISNDTCYADINSTASSFTIDALTYCNRVSFRLAFNINGSANDNSYADTQGTGFYRANNISKYYACIEDSSLQNAIGIIQTGAQLDYINVTSGSIAVSETQEGNRFSVPVVGSTCGFIGNKSLSYPLQPFISTGEGLGAIELVLNYPEIDIRGDYEREGSFTIVMERNISDDKQLIVDII